jgi:hypothetical protein
MLHLRGIAIIDHYMDIHEIFTLYVPKEIDYDYWLTVYSLCDKYQYFTDKFIKGKVTYLLFYPRGYEIPSNPMHKSLVKFRLDFSKK